MINHRFIPIGVCRILSISCVYIFKLTNYKLRKNGKKVQKTMQIPAPAGAFQAKPKKACTLWCTGFVF